MQDEKVLTELPALTTLRVSNGALRGEKLPERIKIFQWGENPSIKGTFKAGDHTLAVLEANQRSLGFERVAIDYNHCTVPGSPDYQAGKPPAVFGYGTVRVKSGDGIYLEDVTWTPLGTEHARNFEDLSPAVAPSKGGEIELIHSVALTTNGALKDVTFFSATTTTEDKETMSTTSSPGTGNFLTLAILASTLGLAATATEAEVTGELKTLSALKPLSDLIKDGKIVVLDEVANLNQRLAAIETANTKGIATLSAQVNGKTVTITAEDLVNLSAKLEALEQRLTESSTAAASRERGEIIALFAREGKAPKNGEGKELSAEELGKLDVSTLKMLHANTPVTVPLHARGARADDSKNHGLKGLARSAAAFQAQFEAGRQS